MTELTSKRFPNIIVNIDDLGGDRFKIIASVCRAMARANINPMTIANFSNIASSAADNETLFKLCNSWVTLRGKEPNGQTTTETTKPNVSSLT